MFWVQKKKNNYIYDVIIKNGCECKLGKMIYQNNHIKYLHLQQVVPDAMLVTLLSFINYDIKQNLWMKISFVCMIIRQEFRKQMY